MALLRQIKISMSIPGMLFVNQYQCDRMCFEINTSCEHITAIRIESTKTTSMEDVSTGVLEKIKNIQEVKIKPKMIWCIKTYIIAYVKIQKKWRYTIHYFKPTAQLLFKNRFPKGGPTCRRQVVNPRHQTSEGQSAITELDHNHNTGIQHIRS